MSTSPAPDDLPVRVGDFEIVGVLGQGGSGVVYDARWGHREVALKVLHPSLVATAKEREQFLAEARRLAEIAHPGVVKVLSVGETTDGRPYLAMEKLDGETLAARLARGPIGAEIALRLFAQLADAVSALHERGLVHRDLKPENVVLVTGAAGEHAVLLDFGIAKSLAEPASTTTQDGHVRGTPAYMAPERFFGSPASIATDVYELGVVLFAMLAGRLPWDDCGNPEVRLNPLRLADAAPGLPAALDVEVARALSTRGANRPATARAFEDAVRAAAGTAMPPASSSGRMTADVKPHVTPPQVAAWFDVAKQEARSGGDLAVAPTVNARRGRRRARWPWIAVAIVVLAGGVAVAVIATRGRGVVAEKIDPDDPWAASGSGTGTATGKSSGAVSAASTEAVAAKKIVPPRSDRPLRKELAASIGHFPHDTKAVVGVVVDELRQDPDLASMIFADVRAKQIAALLEVEGCSIDFARTTDWAAIGISEGTKNADAIISGRWTRDAIEACLGGASRSEIQHLDDHGVALTRLHGKAGDRWLGWLDDRTFFITTRPSTDAAWMTARVHATDGPGGTIATLAPELNFDVAGWAIADAAAVSGTDVVGKIPPGHVIARVTLGDPLDIRIRVRYPDADTAHKAHQIIDEQIDASAAGARELGIMTTEDHDTAVDIRITLARSMLHAVAAQALEQ